MKSCALPINILTSGARTALYTILVSICGDISPCLSNYFKAPNLQVNRSQQLETELYKLNKQYIQLLTFYSIYYRGNILPESHNTSTIVDIANGCLVESARFIQQSFLVLAMRIPNPEGNATVERVSRGALNLLPQNPVPTTVAILRCLEESIKRGLCIPDTEHFVLE
ncbi:hypothetical protein BDW75DRAFT_232578 [Aspergillus navahoensis]